MKSNFAYCSERDTSFSIVVGGGRACASVQFRPDQQHKLDNQKIIIVSTVRYNFKANNIKLDIICITKFRTI